MRCLAVPPIGLTRPRQSTCRNARHSAHTQGYVACDRTIVLLLVAATGPAFVATTERVGVSSKGDYGGSAWTELRSERTGLQVHAACGPPLYPVEACVAFYPALECAPLTFRYSSEA